VEDWTGMTDVGLGVSSVFKFPDVVEAVVVEISSMRFPVTELLALTVGEG